MVLKIRCVFASLSFKSRLGFFFHSWRYIYIYMTQLTLLDLPSFRFISDSSSSPRVGDHPGLNKLPPQNSNSLKCTTTQGTHAPSSVTAGWARYSGTAEQPPWFSLSIVIHFLLNSRKCKQQAYNDKKHIGCCQGLGLDPKRALLGMKQMLF